MESGQSGRGLTDLTQQDIERRSPAYVAGSTLLVAVAALVISNVST
jgi:hypothetical protein